MEKPPSLWRKIFLRTRLYAAIAASLLIFPAALPWMTAFWLGLYVVGAARRKPRRIFLALGIGLALVKGPDLSPALVLLLAVMAVVLVVDWRGGDVRPRIPALAAAWVFLAWTWHTGAHASRALSFDKDRPIVCLGDSLSAFGYPRELAKRVRVPVVDGSVGGIRTDEALPLLSDLLKQNPHLVILELGGHDYLQGKGRAHAKANLETMIAACRAAGAEVVLFEIPRGFVFDPFWGLDRALARKHDLELVPDGAIRWLVFRSPFLPIGPWLGDVLSDDGLHPNDRGNVFMAERALAALRRLYGDAILAR